MVMRALDITVITVRLSGDIETEQPCHVVIGGIVTGLDGPVELAGTDWMQRCLLGEEVGDIVMAHSMISTIGEGPTPMQQAITIENAEINVSDISEDRFTMPEVEAEEPAATE